MKQEQYIWWGLGLAGLAGGIYLLKLGRLARELEISSKVRIHKVTLSGVQVRADVVLKNPTSGTVRVKHPFVKLIYGDRTLGTSVVQNQDYQLPGYGELAMKPVDFQLDFLALASGAPGLLLEYRSKKTISLTVKIITTINGSIPIDHEENITIG